MSDDAASVLTVSERHDGRGACELCLVGDVDLSSLPTLSRHVEQMLTMSPRTVGFELSGVGFMDSSGIGVLLQVADAVSSVTLVNPSTAVRRLVELSGLTSILPITDVSPVSPVSPGTPVTPVTPVTS